ncbi:MAG TPA: FHA domain-containing protein [Anaeromyxobacteraceae bacterium]|nr:FHA domain-containing protein [Anaeromyxobacteraceae bacterium]
MAEPIVHALRLPDWTLTALVVALAAGFPVTAVLSWVFDIGPRGFERTAALRGSDATLAPPTQAPTVRRRAGPHGPLPVTLRVVRGEAEPQEARFGETFVVGRSRECDVRAVLPFVSRQHLRVSFDGERWSLRDLGTMSGTYVDGKPIRELALEDAVEVEIGQGGPCLAIAVERPGGNRPPDGPGRPRG